MERKFVGHGRSSQRSIPMVPMPGALPSSRLQRAGKENSEANGSDIDDREDTSNTIFQSQESIDIHFEGRAATHLKPRFLPRSLSGSKSSMSSSSISDRKSSTSSSRSSSIQEYKKRYENVLKANSDQSLKLGTRHSSQESSSRSRAKESSSRQSRTTNDVDSHQHALKPAICSSNKHEEPTDHGKFFSSSEGGRLENQRTVDLEREFENNPDSGRNKAHRKYSSELKTSTEVPRNSTNIRRSSVADGTVTTKSPRNSSLGGGSGYRTRISGGLTGREIKFGQANKRPSNQSGQGDDISLPIAQTIALLGASGMTGGRLLHSALDAGYLVRCLPSDDPRQTSGKHTNWKILQAEMEDTQQLEMLLHGVSYVVVMINDLLPRKNSEYPVLFLTKLVRKLYAMMRREDMMHVFLFQSTSLASDVTGQTPVLSKFVKSTTRRRDQFMLDLDSVMKRIAEEHGLRPCKSNQSKDVDQLRPHFSFVVTRPTILLQNGPGCKRLFASKSVSPTPMNLFASNEQAHSLIYFHPCTQQPGPVPISHVDLAEFTLNALTSSKLYNSSPYVVADCF